MRLFLNANNPILSLVTVFDWEPTESILYPLSLTPPPSHSNIDSVINNCSSVNCITHPSLKSETSSACEDTS